METLRRALKESVYINSGYSTKDGWRLHSFLGGSGLQMRPTEKKLIMCAVIITILWCEVRYWLKKNKQSCSRWSEQSFGDARSDWLSVFGLYVLYSVTAANMTEHLQPSLFGPETQILQSDVMLITPFSLVQASLQQLPPGTHLSIKQAVHQFVKPPVSPSVLLMLPDTWF